jgi:hypothetical protein
MINKEIEIIIDDMLFHTKKILKFLEKVNPKEYYDAYLDDLFCYALCTKEDIQTIKQYIFELETKLYYTLGDMENGGDSNKK